MLTRQQQGRSLGCRVSKGKRIPAGVFCRSFKKRCCACCERHAQYQALIRAVLNFNCVLKAMELGCLHLDGQGWPLSAHVRVTLRASLLRSVHPRPQAHVAHQKDCMRRYATFSQKRTRLPRKASTGTEKHVLLAFPKAVGRRTYLLRLLAGSCIDITCIEICTSVVFRSFWAFVSAVRLLSKVGFLKADFGMTYRHTFE